MKISKLFHWLYCAVMFLPLIMFLPNGLYYAFNEHATNSETTNINYKYQSNEVNSLADLHIGNVYELTLSNELSSDIFNGDSGYLQVIILKTYGLYFENFTDQSLDVLNNDLDGTSEPYIELQVSYGSLDIFVYLNQDDVMYADFYYADPIEESFSFNGVVQLLDFSDLVTHQIFKYSDYNIISSVVFSNDDTITNKMYQGWQQVWDLPVFSWTHNTFFSAPFNYISSLFGFQAGNSISYLLSYWFSISIIWLVFDLMIYVPLLVHRWLDKASIS